MRPLTLENISYRGLVGVTMVAFELKKFAAPIVEQLG